MSYLVTAGPPQPGYTCMVGPGTRGLRLLELGVLRLAEDVAFALATGAREAVLYLLGGAGVLDVAARTDLAQPKGLDIGDPAQRAPSRDSAGCLATSVAPQRFEVGPRLDAFTASPWAVYLPPDTSCRVVGGAGGLFGVLVFAPSASRSPAALVGPRDAVSRSVGTANWRRTVRSVVDAARGAERLMVGETLNLPGNWSSYPPHKHDTRSAAGELPMEEVYFYLTRPGGGFGLQMLYTAASATDPIDEVYCVRNGDALAIPRGYHPVVAAAGYELLYVWAMAGDESRYGAWSDDPAHAWVREREHEGTGPIPRSAARPAAKG